MREEETDIRLSEHFEAREYVEASEYYPVPEEICEGREEWKQTSQKEKHGRRGKIQLLKRMGYLVAASLAVVTISRAMTGETDTQVRKSNHVVDFTSMGYDSFGDAYGGVIPVERNGFWGAVDYEFHEIIPCIYNRASEPTEKGYLVLKGNTENENGEKATFSYLYDNRGKMIFTNKETSSYDWEFDLRATSDLYFLLSDREGLAYNWNIYNKEGKALYSKHLDALAGNNGIPCTMSDGNIFLQRIVEGQTEYGLMNEKGKITWSKAKKIETKPKKKNIFQKIWHFILYLEFPEDETEDGFEETSLLYAKGNDFVPFNSFQNGMAFLSHADALSDGAGALIDEDYNVIASFGLQNCIPDSRNGFSFQNQYQGIAQYPREFRSYYYNGGYFYNYGTKMVWHFGGKDVLVDLALYPGMTEETMDNRIVKAIHDRIRFSGETYWLFEDSYQGVHFIGYMDHDGNVKRGYDNATEFAKGQALVVEQGKTYLIDEKFRKIQSFGKTGEIGKAGDLLYIVRDGSILFVNL